MVKKYENIVVGAGFSGLFTGAYLAASGRSVILIEKNYRCGGLFQTLNVFDEEWFLGPHHIGGLSKDNFIHEAFKTIGINMEEEFDSTDEFEVLIDEKIYRVPLDLGKMSEYIKDNFNVDNRIERFIEEIKSYQNHFNSNYEKGLLDMFIKTSRISYQEYLEQYFDDEELLKLLCFLGPGYGAVGVKDSAFSNLSLLVTYTIGAYYTKRGNGNLIKLLTKCYIENGGELITGLDVDDIIHENNRVKGVVGYTETSRKRRTIYGENIIFASNPFEILKKRVGGLRALKKVEKLKIGPSALRVYCLLKEYPMHSSDIAYLGNSNLDEMDKVIFLDDNSNKLPICMISFPNRISDSKKKIGMITFLSYSTSLLDNRKNIIGLINKYLPEVGKNIIDYRVVDYNLYKSISNTETGSVFGWERNTETVMITNSIAPRISGLEDLYLVGNWSTDFGIYGCIRSSKKVCDIILEELYDLV